MDMRIRLPELLTENGVSAYELARRSEGRILPATLYRLVKQQGRVRLIDGDLVETIMDVLDVDLPAVLEWKARGKKRGGEVKRRYIRDAERAALRAAWQYRCAYCGERSSWLKPEHVEPLSRGGDDTPENLVASCGACNSSKSDLFLLEWVLVRSGFWKRTKAYRATCYLPQMESAA